MSTTLPNNIDYLELDYWNRRYSNEDSFDWCKGYSSFKHLIHSEVKPSDRILMLGCGNSSLSEEMYKDGYHSITNIDYSSVVIENMKNHSTEARQMQWVVMDINDLKFEKGAFDVVIEKATLDALLVNEQDPWHMTKENQHLLDSILKQVSNILTDGGRFISITFAQPHFRKRLYAQEHLNWNIRLQTFGEGFHFFFYTMTKGQILSQQDICKPIEAIQQPTKFLEEEDQESFLYLIEA